MQTKLAHLGLAFLLAYEPASLKVFHIASLTKHGLNELHKSTPREKARTLNGGTSKLPP
jgi:hypothetical protein